MSSQTDLDLSLSHVFGISLYHIRVDASFRSSGGNVRVRICREIIHLILRGIWLRQHLLLLGLATMIFIRLYQHLLLLQGVGMNLDLIYRLYLHR